MAAGALARPPSPPGQAFQYTLSTLGRLKETEQFGNIIVRTGTDGQITRMVDIVSEKRQVKMDGGKTRSFGGIELGAKAEDTGCTLDGQDAVGLAIYQLPGSNALDTAELIKKRMEELKKNFPDDLDHAIRYATTPLIAESIHAVSNTLPGAIILATTSLLLFL